MMHERYTYVGFGDELPREVEILFAPDPWSYMVSGHLDGTAVTMHIPITYFHHNYARNADIHNG